MTKKKQVGQIKRYSLAFKQKVVSEIESGKLTIEQARRVYDIGGGQTVQNWIKQFGKFELLKTVVRIEMKDEADKVKALERQIKELKLALADKDIENRVLETVIKLASEHYKTDLKKNLGTQPLNKPPKKGK